MLILAQIPESNLSFPSLEKLHEGGLVSPWRPELISVGRSGMKWRGRVMVFWGEGLEPALALAKREGDWGNVLNTCNRWNLVNVWECLGGWEGDEEEECIVSREPELHRREEGVQEKKKTRLVPQIPAHHISFPSDESCWTEIVEYSFPRTLR